ncbi:MAG: family 43 glycosylhydrolase [Oscillospiraceae bacterium]|nr:family 43 glycosylhydrolase [Oscillospiraceae bacterium]
MKKIVLYVSSVIMAVSAITSSSAMICKAANPMVQTIYSTDPAPMVYDGVMYCYTGRDKDNADFYYMPDWHCYSTTDMQNWTDHGMLLSWNSFTWGKEDSAWAAQCTQRNGKFYYYVTLENKSGGGRGIGVAVADSPTGPFKDAIGKPLAGPNWDYIDPTVFIDDDGQAWLMWGNPKCYYAKLNEDMISLDGPVQSFNMTAEAFGPTSRNTGSSYGEGPWFYKRGSLYYLIYSAFGPGNSSEDIRYSTAPSPTGPWTYRGVIMPPQPGNFTNHSGVADYKGHSYFFYHNTALKGGGIFDRSTCVEEFTYNADGTFNEIKCTKEGPAQLEALDPYKKTEAETICWSEGVKTEACSQGGVNVSFIENGDYVMVKGVDFKEGAKSFKASTASDGSGGKIEMHLDSKDGKLIGSCEVPVTGGWQDYQTVSCAVSGAEGEHDLYFVFTGGSSYLYNIDWWQFEGETVDFTPGDINSDGKINILDFCLQISGVLGKFDSKAATLAADVNGDGSVTAADIILLRDYLLGINDSL